MSEISFQPKREEDCESMLEVARALPQWFTPEGLADMAEDFKLHEGFAAKEIDLGYYHGDDRLLLRKHL